MSWHLTVGESAFLAPAGVVLGAVVSYFAVRRSARDNLAAQGLAIAANAEQERLRREADIERERRDHLRDGYRRAASALEEIDIATEHLLRSVRRLPPFDDQEAQVRQRLAEASFSRFWKIFHDRASVCRSELIVASSDGVRALRHYLTTATKVFQEYSPSVDFDGATPWLSRFRFDDASLSHALVDGPFDADSVLAAYLEDLGTLALICEWGIARIRYELGLTGPVPSLAFGGRLPQSRD